MGKEVVPITSSWLEAKLIQISGGRNQKELKSKGYTYLDFISGFSIYFMNL
jgi:hypothetical protein